MVQSPVTLGRDAIRALRRGILGVVATTLGVLRGNRRTSNRIRRGFVGYRTRRVRRTVDRGLSLLRHGI